MKEPINYGALDPQQRLDVARGQPAPSVEGMDVAIPRELAVWVCEFMNKGGNCNPPGMDFHDAFYALRDAMLPAAPVPPVQGEPAERGAVVLPERLTYHNGQSATIDGWNACLDEFARLNPAPPAAQDASGQWVPVSERLPEVGQYLFVAGPRGSDMKDGFYRMTGIMREDGIYDGYGCWLSDATHWMPLPDAPAHRQASQQEGE